MTLEEKLAQAEAAYHSLMVGGAVKVVVDQNGERVEYDRPNAANLAKYIQQLKQELGLTSNRPMRFWN